MRVSEFDTKLTELGPNIIGSPAPGTTTAGSTPVPGTTPAVGVSPMQQAALANKQKADERTKLQASLKQAQAQVQAAQKQVVDIQHQLSKVL